jgi:lipid-binding SYLF domain-containing protein
MFVNSLFLMFCTNMLFGATNGLRNVENRKRLNNSVAVFKRILDIPDKEIPRELVNETHCIVVVLAMKQCAFIIGLNMPRDILLQEQKPCRMNR